MIAAMNKTRYFRQWLQPMDLSSKGVSTRNKLGANLKGQVDALVKLHVQSYVLSTSYPPAIHQLSTSYPPAIHQLNTRQTMSLILPKKALLVKLHLVLKSRYEGSYLEPRSVSNV